jgi:DNA-directed RNA polymerase subunit RPC12/RpoP
MHLDKSFNLVTKCFYFTKGCEDMQSIYTSYNCSKCRKEFVLLTDDVEALKGYLVCPFCSSQRIKKQKATDNLKECMSHRRYRKENGVTKQR